MVFTAINYADDIKVILSAHKASLSYGKIESRKSHAFLFRIRGDIHYIFPDRELDVKAGEIIFLPRGSVYEYTVADSENSLYTSVNFQGTLKDPFVKVYPFEVFHGSNYIAESFTELWKFGSEADKLRCLSLFYDFLAHVFDYENLESEDERRHRLIEPGVEYLKRHLYDSDLRIDRLHTLCGVSDTYFRKIFAARFGVSPKSYVLRERISHAKSIIESGDFGSMREVAEAVGYNDPLYFSKAFKKLYATSPSAYFDKLKNE